MNKDEVMEYLKGEEGQGLISELGYKQLNRDVVDEYLKGTDEGKSLLFSITDKAKEKAVSNWKEKYLKSEVQKELDRLNPQLTDEQKRIKELEAEISKRDYEAKINSVVKSVKEYNKSKGYELPEKVIELLCGDDEEKAKMLLDEIGAEYNTNLNNRITKEVDTRLSKDPKPGVLADTTSKKITLEQYVAMSDEQRKELNLSLKELTEMMQ